MSVKVGESDAEEVSCTSNRWTFSLSSFADAQFAAVVSYKDAAENMVEVTVGPLERDVVVPTVSGDYEVVDGTYHPGGILSFAINYSEDVMVKGVPTLAFELGTNNSSTTKQAIYAEGSGSSQLIFKYAISATDVDSDGIQVTNGSALTFSQGIEITDGVGNAVTASPAIKDFSNVLIATAASVSATVSSFAPFGRQTYKVGDELIITAALSGTIDLGATDAPSLSLAIGDDLVTAACKSSSCNGSAQTGIIQLQFSYTILDGQNASRVLVKALDAGGMALGLGTLLPFSLPGVSVDTTKPVVTGLSDGSAVANSGAWSWGCEDASLSCTYRSFVSQSDTHTWVGNTTFTTNHEATIASPTTGKWYLHVQALDDAENESETKTVFVDIDVTMPTINTAQEVVFPAAGEYSHQDRLEFEVSFSESVSVVDTPRLTLTVGSTTRYADYHRMGDSGEKVIFRYVVAADDADTDGIALATTIEANGGSIADRAGNAVSDLTALTLPDPVPVITIDAAPVISEIALPDQAPTKYKINDSLTINVTFNESVVVTGHPALILDVGGARVRASYEGDGTSQTVHPFGLSVVAPINGESLSVLSLDLGQGGSIVDGQQNAAVLDFSAKQLAVALDAIFPRPTNIGEVSKRASSVSWSWGCSESGCTYRSVINEQAQHSFQESDAYTETATLSESSGLTEDAVYYLHLQVKDAAGNEGKFFHYSVHYDTIVPTIAELSGVPDDKTYFYGKLLSFSVRFSEAVTVTDGSQPVLKIRVRGNSDALNDNQLHEVPYLEGSGTDTLVFKYAVASGVVDADGIELLATLSLKGGTIKDSAGNDLADESTFTVPTMGINLDGAAPTVLSVKFVDGSSIEITDLTYLKKAGEGLIELALSEQVTLDTAQGSPELVLDVGGAVKRAIFQPPASFDSTTNIDKLLFKYTVQDGDNDSDGVGYTEVDLNGSVLADSSGSGLIPLTGASLANFIIDTTVPTVSMVRADGATHNTYGSF